MKRAPYLLIPLVLVTLTYAAWHWFMASRVDEIKATIAHHNQQLKATTPTMVLKAEDVRAAGFPFHFRVEITKLTLSMIEGDETFLTAIGPIEISKNHLGAAVKIPAQFDALYAKSGAAPEEYNARVSDLPELVLTRETAGQGDAPPFTHFRMLLPKAITLNMTLGDTTKDARFDMPPSNIMIEHKIPDNLQRPLWLLVSVMREALVFDTRNKQ